MSPARIFAAIAGVSLLAAAAHADITVTFEQFSQAGGGDLLRANVTGSLDVTQLTRIDTGNELANENIVSFTGATPNLVAVGDFAAVSGFDLFAFDLYELRDIAGDRIVLPPIGTADFFNFGPGFVDGDDQLFILDGGSFAAPFNVGFAAGTNSVDLDINFAGESLNSFGLTPGTTTVPTAGGNLIITVVPEPAAATLLGLGGLALLHRRARA